MTQNKKKTVSSEGYDTSEALERNLAFASGLESESPTEVSSAVYICTELDGLPRLENDFEFKRGYGISSEAIQLNLAFLYEELKRGDYDEIEEEREKGEIFKEYEDELIDLALYLYKENNPNRRKTNGWRNETSRLEEREEELEEMLEKIRERLN
jgi:hypothetical protein